MIYPPGQGKSGQQLMQLWRDYLEQYADKEGDVEGQAMVGANQSVELLTAFCRTLDSNERYKALIVQRLEIFHEGGLQAADFSESILNAAFSLYNCLNTLAHQLTEGNPDSSAIISNVDEQARLGASTGDAAERSAVAMRACFPLLALVTIALDQSQEMTDAIRQVEQRFASAAKAATTSWVQLINALYRLVEMAQILALLSDADLRDQINQIASRFKEEDQSKELKLKLRNGFCRFFELSHLLITHIDAMIE